MALVLKSGLLQSCCSNQTGEASVSQFLFAMSNAALNVAFSVFGSFIKQHSEASGRIAGLAAQAEGAGDELEEGVDEFEALRRISEDEGDQYDNE